MSKLGDIQKEFARSCYEPEALERGIKLALTGEGSHKSATVEATLLEFVTYIQWEAFKKGRFTLAEQLRSLLEIK